MSACMCARVSVASWIRSCTGTTAGIFSHCRRLKGLSGHTWQRAQQQQQQQHNPSRGALAQTCLRAGRRLCRYGGAARQPLRATECSVAVRQEMALAVVHCMQAALQALTPARVQADPEHLLPLHMCCGCPEGSAPALLVPEASCMRTGQAYLYLLVPGCKLCAGFVRRRTHLPQHVLHFFCFVSYVSYVSIFLHVCTPVPAPGCPCAASTARHDSQLALGPERRDCLLSVLCNGQGLFSTPHRWSGRRGI